MDNKSFNRDDMNRSICVILIFVKKKLFNRDHCSGQKYFSGLLNMYLHNRLIVLE